MKNFLLPVAVVLLLTSCNESRRGNDSNVNEDRDEAAAESNRDKFGGKKQKDAEFVFEAVEANYAEIKMAGLGNQRSKNPQVKEIAQTLLTDHAAALNDLKTVAQAKAISVPVEETSAARRNIESMAGEADKDFDRAWCDEMTKMHESTIKSFERRFEDTEDPELKAYISKTLPILKDHRERLKRCSETLTRGSKKRG